MRRALKIAALLLILVILAGLLWLRSTVRGSLAQLDGAVELAGLTTAVTIERDDLGVPRILAGSATDAIRALGFLHGQERFFQMDLLRRRAAGELSALLGPAAIGADRAVRLHRLRARAEAIVAAAGEDSRRELTAYAEGVNAGLERIGRPLEYVLLRDRPEPWRPSDSVLAVYTMYLRLQDENGSRDSARGIMRDTLPGQVVEFLLPRGSEWDAPLVGDAYETPPVPGPDVWDLRSADSAPPEARPRTGEPSVEEPQPAGSNNWAVAGHRTADGGALVANDMHLTLGMPGIWYRASLHWTDAGVARRATGVTLPGVFGVVVGSTPSIAWAFTNLTGDLSDLVELEFVDGSDTRYRTPDGEADLEVFEETIEVKGGDDVTVTVEETIWGPVVDEDHRGTRRAVRWVGHDTGSVNLAFMALAKSTTLDEIFAVAHRTGIPAQNIVAADAGGRIGWTVVGPLPDRFGFDGRFPVSWSDGMRGWRGRLAPADVPQLRDPPSGVIWTANNRTMDGVERDRIGDGGYALGARAKQIRDSLLAIESATAQDMLDLQLDDRALFLERWRDLLLNVLREQNVRRTAPRHDELLRQIETTWTGRASIDSVAYRMVRAWRQYVATRVFEPLTAPCRTADPEFDYFFYRRFEGPLWRILEERPEHLLEPSYADWAGLLVAAVDDLVMQFMQEPTDSLDGYTWGDRNRFAMTHPMSRSLPGFVRRHFDLPIEQLPGDSRMPRVQGRVFGASERSVVSPGRESDGLFHMPGGQSGHPFSPFYDAGHRAWADGAAAPFLPGETRHTLVLRPAR
ncbi:MAG: penicillin acylase family protein [Acidobacteria bacterium]|nr:penicillin acylase family protein [Acidobacteriota bacterium]NIM62844.1 penicillin acylase family protein [Acidobacteriota bacterium]NIO60474.1 penicillin acylase family protein [Acidobacteriota bacterium]NIQ31580.1 penicillin acylase family protein [Acidobacteriota bacterium]NIQ86830.1 penicillin acylase family protein [Acidobacteriota bacterium]